MKVKDLKMMPTDEIRIKKLIDALMRTRRNRNFYKELSENYRELYEHYREKDKSNRKLIYDLKNSTSCQQTDN